ncbi:DNA internalization-related competence protein ComEC/Rec2 [Legionella sp. CNM-4043-24]|uniref:DNA internalization-related competence protein ComEC/Rec2 n=1 Tax=Legionella sp. CNM-4043-24 TaxID=3421646 RepID=UPI00403AF448
MEILCFLAGTVFACAHSPYPLLFLLSALFLKADWRILLWFAAAILWVLLHQWWVSDRAMPDTDLIPKARVTGRIASLPVVRDGSVQFGLSVSRLNADPVQARVLLSCYRHCPEFSIGQRWRLQVKLKKARAAGNPGQFDYRRMLSARHVHWTGYLKGGQAVLLEDATQSFTLPALRARLAEKLEHILPDQGTLGITQALALGLTQHLNQAQWDLFRRTGTTHLMVISGAHISLVAGLASCFVYWLWLGSSRLCLYRPAVQAAAVAGIVTALTYALLAGFSVPAQRALFAFCLVLLRYFFSQRLSAWQTWRYALLLVIIIEPHAVLLSGFYLSFLAVAVLIACGQRFPVSGYKKALVLQLACLIGLMPVTLFFFSYGAVDGLLANLVAIPLVGYVIVPLSLTALLLSLFSPPAWTMLPLTYAIKILMIFLAWVDRLSMINLDVTLASSLSLPALMISLFLFFFLPISSLRPYAFVLLITAVHPAYYQSRAGEARVRVLDVGQGLSVLITTAHHSLLYDTGMKFYKGSDMGKMVIIPFLATQGIGKLDKIVISHPDMDHRGGLASLEKRFPAAELLVDNPSFYRRGKSCHEYPAWTWDGVSFRFLSIRNVFRAKNNSSCVLQVRSAGGSVLLPGDVESRAEHYLASTWADELISDVLILPHHGSKTSSTPEFIQQVSPRYAIISAGFDNRYHFPHQPVTERMQQAHIAMFNTMDCGMITVDLPSRAPMDKPLCYR